MRSYSLKSLLSLWLILPKNPLGLLIVDVLEVIMGVISLLGFGDLGTSGYKLLSFLATSVDCPIGSV